MIIIGKRFRCESSDTADIYQGNSIEGTLAYWHASSYLRSKKRKESPVKVGFVATVTGNQALFPPPSPPRLRCSVSPADGFLPPPLSTASFPFSLLSVVHVPLSENVLVSKGCCLTADHAAATLTKVSPHLQLRKTSQCPSVLGWLHES